MTERSPADAAALETAERYRLAVRATNDAIWDWHFATNHVLWNEALETAHGHKLGDVEPTGEWWLAHIHPDDRARIDHSIHTVIEGTADHWSDHYRFERADGSYAHVLDRGYVIRDEHGLATRMIGAMLDLTEQRRNQEQLRLSEARYRVLFESIESGFCEVEVKLDDGIVDYRVVEANPAFFHRPASRKPSWANGCALPRRRWRSIGSRSTVASRAPGRRNASSRARMRLAAGSTSTPSAFRTSRATALPFSSTISRRAGMPRPSCMTSTVASKRRWRNARPSATACGIRLPT